MNTHLSETESLFRKRYNFIYVFILFRLSSALRYVATHVPANRLLVLKHQKVNYWLLQECCGVSGFIKCKFIQSCEIIRLWTRYHRVICSICHVYVHSIACFITAGFLPLVIMPAFPSLPFLSFYFICIYSSGHVFSTLPSRVLKGIMW